MTNFRKLTKMNDKWSSVKRVFLIIRPWIMTWISVEFQGNVGDNINFKIRLMCQVWAVLRFNFD